MWDWPDCASIRVLPARKESIKSTCIMTRSSPFWRAATMMLGVFEVGCACLRANLGRCESVRGESVKAGRILNITTVLYFLNYPQYFGNFLLKLRAFRLKPHFLFIKASVRVQRIGIVAGHVSRDNLFPSPFPSRIQKISTLWWD
jgi:hypothetical protein